MDRLHPQEKLSSLTGNADREFGVDPEVEVGRHQHPDGDKEGEGGLPHLQIPHEVMEICHLHHLPDVDHCQERPHQNQESHPPHSMLHRSENQVPLAHEAHRQGNADEGEAPRHESGHGPWHPLGQTLHGLDPHRSDLVHHSPHGHEEGAFDEGMVEEVEKPGGQTRHVARLTPRIMYPIWATLE